MQAGLSKTPMHLAAVYIYIYIRMVFRHLCGGRQEHLWGEPPPRTFFLALLHHNGITTRKRQTYLGGASSTLSSMSCHNIVIKITTLSSMGCGVEASRVHNIVIAITTLSSMSHHCHRHHNIVIDIVRVHRYQMLSVHKGSHC